jgi:hypothetical protein
MRDHRRSRVRGVDCTAPSTGDDGNQAWDAEQACGIDVGGVEGHLGESLSLKGLVGWQTRWVNSNTPNDSDRICL